MAEKKEWTFEESMRELELIVKGLETGDVPLEQALEQFKKGIELSRTCQETLMKAEETLTHMMSENGKEVVFEGEGE